MDVVQHLINISYSLISAVAIGLFIVEYTWWRTKRKVISTINEVLEKIKEDEVLKKKLEETVDQIIDYAIEHLKKKIVSVKSNADPKPPKLEYFLELGSIKNEE